MIGITDGGREIYLPETDDSTFKKHFADVRVEDIRNHKLSGVIKCQK